MDDLNKFKDRLNEALALRDMTPQQLADVSGLHFTTVYRYLKGLRKPNSDSIERMAIALHVSPSWLFGYDVPMNGEPDFIYKKGGVTVIIEDVTDKEATEAAIIELLKKVKGVDDANADI